MQDDETLWGEEAAVSDELFDLVGLDPNDREAQEAVADARVASELIMALTSARRSAGLSQKAVAERMGTTQSAISELERVATDPYLSTLQRFSRAVGGRLTWKVVLDGGWTQLGRKQILADTQVEPDIDESPGVGAPWEPLTQGKTAIRIVN